ncbi:MAG TPA: TPM domain-containing protein [Caulobacteraceae bacterium]
MLSVIDEDRIAAAVNTAEQGTSGEIVCVLAGEVSTYGEVPLAWAAALVLVLPPIALAFGLHPLAIASAEGLWTASQASALESQLALVLVAYATAQVVLFAIAYLVISIAGVRRMLTPPSLKRHRVAKAAHQQFVAVSSRAVGSDTGVLIFVALDDRQVRIIAHEGIHEKAGEPAWARAAKAIQTAMKDGADPTAGIVEAIAICGAALAQHYPAKGPRAPDALDRPLEV